MSLIHSCFQSPVFYWSALGRLTLAKSIMKVPLFLHYFVLFQKISIPPPRLVWTLLPTWNFQFSFILSLKSFGHWDSLPLGISNHHPWGLWIFSGTAHCRIPNDSHYLFIYLFIYLFSHSLINLLVCLFTTLAHISLFATFRQLNQEEHLW